MRADEIKVGMTVQVAPYGTGSQETVDRGINHEPIVGKILSSGWRKAPHTEQVFAAPDNNEPLPGGFILDERPTQGADYYLIRVRGEYLGHGEWRDSLKQSPDPKDRFVFVRAARLWREWTDDTPAAVDRANGDRAADAFAAAQRELDLRRAIRDGRRDAQRTLTGLVPRPFLPVWALPESSVEAQPLDQHPAVVGGTGEVSVAILLEIVQAAIDNVTDEARVEVYAEQVHIAWMGTKRSQGIESRPSEWGEEQMVPYADLSERAKDLDRGTVRSVLAAIRATS